MTLQRYVPSSRTLWLISQEKVGDHESPPFLISNRPHPSCKVGCRTVDLAQCEGRALAAQPPDHHVSPFPSRNAIGPQASNLRVEDSLLLHYLFARPQVRWVGYSARGEDQEAGLKLRALIDTSITELAPRCLPNGQMGSFELMSRVWNLSLGVVGWKLQATLLWWPKSRARMIEEWSEPDRWGRSTLEEENPQNSLPRLEEDLHKRQIGKASHGN